ncbi:MAG: hypothetical protein K5697_11255 [Lachnospiraceae bacterium]|nr:hypothetical protein [Lachnospiraceae bacterium]
MKLFGPYLKSKLGGIAIFICFFSLVLICFAFYGLPMKAIIYPALLCSVLGLLYLAYGFCILLKRHRELCGLRNTAAELIDLIPQPHSPLEEDYCGIIRDLAEQKRKAAEEDREDRDRMTDYYTLWVHQIKTPIASMRLRLGREDSEVSRKLLSELGRIERYVEMVLTYLRLEGTGSDYVFKEYDLDPISDCLQASYCPSWRNWAW